MSGKINRLNCNIYISSLICFLTLMITPIDGKSFCLIEDPTPDEYTVNPACECDLRDMLFYVKEIELYNEVNRIHFYSPDYPGIDFIGYSDDTSILTGAMINSSGARPKPVKIIVGNTSQCITPTGDLGVIHYLSM